MQPAALHRGGKKMAPEDIDAHEIGADSHRAGAPPPEVGLCTLNQVDP
jgi:hypothetical protein